MRLLNAKTLKLEFFPDSRARPGYAILSHTWGATDDEVSYEDLFNLRDEVRTKKGFAKISSTCSQALKDGHEYSWIDTCCIDKSSSSELSEAINSMFEWYKQSRICYVYMDDVRKPAAEETAEAESSHLDRRLLASRWFTRGWTLQELLAPDEIAFYDQNWSCLGSLSDLASIVSSITRIPSVILRKRRSLHQVSIAKRMSWASTRSTTRIEDEAYSLLGIFGIYMPLLYGEGRNAFVRLQKEIIQNSADHSMFVWQCDKTHTPPYLACSTADFRDSGTIDTLPRPRIQAPYAINNRGLEITVRTVPFTDMFGASTCAILDCFDERPGAEQSVFVLKLRGADRVNGRLATTFTFQDVLMCKDRRGLFDQIRRITILDAVEQRSATERRLRLLYLPSPLARRFMIRDQLPVALNVVDCYPLDAVTNADILYTISDTPPVNARMQPGLYAFTLEFERSRLERAHSAEATQNMQLTTVFWGNLEGELFAEIISSHNALNGDSLAEVCGSTKVPMTRIGGIRGEGVRVPLRGRWEFEILHVYDSLTFRIYRRGWFHDWNIQPAYIRLGVYCSTAPIKFWNRAWARRHGHGVDVLPWIVAQKEDQ